MSNVTVTEERIDYLMETALYDVKTIYGKCTVVTAQLVNGFIIVESSACVDPTNYDQELGEKICKEHIREKLWELEGYALQKKVYEGEYKAVDVSKALEWLEGYTMTDTKQIYSNGAVYVPLFRVKQAFEEKAYNGLLEG